jgi:radical SAM protein with 4Fe4S-binding SPASM domain
VFAKFRRRNRPLPDSWCPLPWTNLSVDVDGSIRPCCKYEHQHEDSKYAFENLADRPMAEIWSGRAMQKLRKDFLAGRRPPGCASCWDEESAGVPSFRQTHLADRSVKFLGDPRRDRPVPVALDLKLSNTCNLRCRICGPMASSSWLNEELRSESLTSEVRVSLQSRKAVLKSNKITGDPQNLATLRAWAPSVQSLELTGGEPMLVDENREILELLLRHGNPSATAITITTNATFIDEAFVELASNFGKVHVALSIDDEGKRFEYQRAPARWSVVEANLDRYAELARRPNTRVAMNTTISTMNVWNFPDFLDWHASRFDRGTLLPIPNLVHYPRHQCIQVLPAELKEAVAPRLLAAADRRWPRWLRARIRGVADFMQDGDDPLHEAWWYGIEVLRERDDVRKESFATSHPEWFAEIDRHGWWQSPQPARRSIRR